MEILEGDLLHNYLCRRLFVYFLRTNILYLGKKVLRQTSYTPASRE